MEINKIVIIKRNYHPEEIYLYVALPDTYNTDQGLSLKTTAPTDTAEVYAAKHFPGVPVEVIDIRHSVSKFSKD